MSFLRSTRFLALACALLVAVSGVSAQTKTEPPNELRKRLDTTLVQLNAVRDVNVQLANDIATLKGEIGHLRAILETMPALIAAGGKAPDQAKVDEAIAAAKDAVDDAAKTTDIGKCLANQGLSVEQMGKPGGYTSMTEDQIRDHAARINACSSDLICKADDADCKKKVDKAIQRLAALLKIVGMILSLTGYPQIGVPMMMMAGSLGKGEGDGEGKGDDVNVTTQGSGPSPCGNLCRSMGGLAAQRAGNLLTVTWTDGSKATFALGKVDGGPNDSTDYLTADPSQKSLVLHRCVAPKDKDTWGGIKHFALATDASGTTVVPSREIALGEGQTCGN